MDLLLDPNMAYLFLLGGFLLGMLALATPGTGVFEVGALFCVALSGYAVYRLSINWWAILFLIASLGVFIYALQNPDRQLYLGVSILLLVIGSVFLFPNEGGFGLAVNPILAALASTLVGGFLWIAARKSIEASFSRPAHDLDALVGQVGEARTDVHDEGSVQVGMELWSAQSDNPIPAGSAVRVVRREGFFIVVEQVQ